MIHDSLSKLKEILHKIDPSGYETATELGEINKYDKSIRISQPLEERNKFDHKWRFLAQAAKQKSSNFIEPNLPYGEDMILCDYNVVYRSIYDKEKFLNS